jgi:hypothetical protein
MFPLFFVESMEQKSGWLPSGSAVGEFGVRPRAMPPGKTVERAAAHAM